MAIEELLKQIDRYYWYGQFPDALALLEQLDTQDEVTELERLQRQLLRCRIYKESIPHIKKTQPLAERIIHRSEALNQPLIKVDALCVLAELWMRLGNYNALMRVIDQGKATLATIPRALSTERAAREAAFLALESHVYSTNGPLERGLEYARRSLTLREQLGHPHAIAESLWHLGYAYYPVDVTRAIEVLQQGLTLSERLQSPLLVADTLFILHIPYEVAGKTDRAIEYLQKRRAICEQYGVTGGELGLAKLSRLYMKKGELNQALEFGRASLALCQKQGIPNTLAEAQSLFHLGEIFALKGELEAALEHLQQSLALFENLDMLVFLGQVLLCISEVYLMQGQLEAAFDHAIQGLRVREETGQPNLICYGLTRIVQVVTALGNLEAAREYLERAQALAEKNPTKLVEQANRLAQAIVLKASARTRDKMKSQELFQQIVNEEVLIAGWTIQANLSLCELLFYEFKTSETPEILHEIQTITQHLLDLATAQQSHSLRAETYLLQAKLALLELDLPRARRLFTQAQMLAEERGLQRLAQSISQEHDTLLTQLPHWETLQAQRAPLQELNQLAGFDVQLSRLTQHRAPEPPELPPEDPIFLLILTTGGLTLFSYSFSEEQHLDEHLISGFLAAISAFGQNALAASGAIDRIMYEEYTIAVKPLASLLVCYIFQGQSYFALQKLDQFLNQIKEIPTLINSLNTTIQRDPPSKALVSLDSEVTAGLQQLIMDIFTPENMIPD